MANTQHIINFIREVRLQVHERSLSDATFLPGISIERGELVVDLGIDASEVFHEEGYKGAGESLVENFEKGGWIGVPLLEWYGMTRYQREDLNGPDFPKMHEWVRKTENPSA